LTIKIYEIKLVSTKINWYYKRKNRIILSHSIPTLVTEMLKPFRRLFAAAGGCAKGGGNDHCDPDD